jgi:hypothetical protein
MGAAWCRDRRKGGKILLAVGISPALKRHMVAHKARTRISMAEQVEAALLAYLPPSAGYDPPVQYARARRPSISWSVISDIGSSAGSRVGPLSTTGRGQAKGRTTLRSVVRSGGSRRRRSGRTRMRCERGLRERSRRGFAASACVAAAPSGWPRRIGSTGSQQQRWTGRGWPLQPCQLGRRPYRGHSVPPVNRP